MFINASFKKNKDSNSFPHLYINIIHCIFIFISQLVLAATHNVYIIYMFTTIPCLLYITHDRMRLRQCKVLLSESDNISTTSKNTTVEISTYNLWLVWWLDFSGFDSLPVDSSEECMVFDVAFPSPGASKALRRVFCQQLLRKHNEILRYSKSESHVNTLQKCLLKRRR